MILVSILKTLTQKMTKKQGKNKNWLSSNSAQIRDRRTFYSKDFGLLLKEQTEFLPEREMSSEIKLFLKKTKKCTNKAKRRIKL